MKKILVILIIGIMLSSCVQNLNYVNGDKAPDFEINNLEGNPIKLSDFEGDFVLLDFWGSWCGPCRLQNPELVKLYNKYHDANFKDDANFQVLSIALENNEKSWKAAIKKDGLIWETHGSDLKRMRSPIAELYGVSSIPTHFLINPNGVVIGIDMPKENIAKVLNKHLEN